MKILVVGDGHSEIHEIAVAGAFRQLGHDVREFYWHRYFSCKRNSAWLRLQNKFILGPRIGRLNADLAAEAVRFAPDLMFVYRGTHVLPSTLRWLKTQLPRCRVLGYNNDDPFAAKQPRWTWRYFLKGLPLYDAVFAYRGHNVSHFLRAGAKRAELLMPWFIPERDRPTDAANRFRYDVVFVGHYENDHRLIYLKALTESGIEFRLFGPDWERAPRSDWLAKLGPIRAVRGEEYRNTLCSARIALCFFSKLNRDTYTRRCFEIPATRTMMLCEYSEDAARLYKEGEEAEFFKTPEEMIEKIRKYLANEPLRASVAEAGYRRVHRDGHDVVSRMRAVLYAA